MKDKDFITGKIESVVKKKDCVNGEKHFKLVYLENRYAYELCNVVMSRKQSNIYKVEVVIGHVLPVIDNTCDITLGSF